MHECTEKERLANIEKTINKIHDKLFVSNGERAMVDIVRENTAWRVKMDGMFKKAIVGLIALIATGHGADKLVEFFFK